MHRALPPSFLKSLNYLRTLHEIFKASIKNFMDFATIISKHMHCKNFEIYIVMLAKKMKRELLNFAPLC